MTPLPGGFDVDYRVLLVAKALLAIIALVVVAWNARVGTQTPGSWPRRALGAVGLLCLAAWWNFGALNGAHRPIHLHDTFHYYIGSKYYAELGYTRLYQCTSVAELERGRIVDVATRWTRDLRTNELFRAAPTPAQIDECHTRFGSRWSAFTGDVEWFRGHMRPSDWPRIFTDKGFNATPVWATMGHWLARTGEASNTQILVLTTIDSFLVLLMWAVVCRTFGWPVACVALAWWGLNESGSYAWLGGAFLRQDAMVLVVCSICAMYAGRRALAGAVLASAVLLRAFPVVLLLGLGIKALWRWRAEGLSATLRAYRPFVIGFAGAAVILVGLTTATWASAWGGASGPWQGFAANTRKHMSGAATNSLGLEPALSFRPATRAAAIERYWLDGPWDTWMAAHAETFQERKPLYWAIAAAFLALLAAAVRNADDHEAIVLGLAILPVFLTLSNYYYSVLLAFAFLWKRHTRIGVALVAFGALTMLLPAALSMRDDRYFVTSVALLLFSAFVLGSFALSSESEVRRASSEASRRPLALPEQDRAGSQHPVR